ncbi:hypothetical protein VE01_06478 [Pseudogymnoascus verrucosus]|uniref:Uncharacterized protein n=1 Tax=Pseudogymnoascus verrucosus TaxID=342668 RepID=A0A1B8GIT5_9PEZI|nr:uncharacterized protein VE01_06478 [Pseudogymnoascus verrucosus]OBT95724.1 hypothetical protein VE01_06478 [Pseudogymnoascus verrucosus]
MSSATTTGAVHGGDSQYISAEPYISITAYGIMVANTKTTKDEQLEMREAELQKWLSSPDQPYTTLRNKKPRRDKK